MLGLETVLTIEDFRKQRPTPIVDAILGIPGVSYIVQMCIDATGDERSGAGKNDPHGDGGRSADKSQEQIDKLTDQVANATGNEKKKLLQKIKNITKSNQKKKKGETHHKR